MQGYKAPPSAHAPTHGNCAEKQAEEGKADVPGRFGAIVFLYAKARKEFFPPGFGVVFTQESLCPLAVLKLPFHLKTAAHAFAHACISLHTQIKRKTAIGNGFEGKTEFTHAGTALECGRVYAVAVHGAFGLAVKLMLSIRANVRAESLVHSVGESAAKTGTRESLALKRTASPCTFTLSPC